MAKRLKTINTIAEVNENYLTTDAMLSILPEYELTRNRAKLEDGSSESSCIKGMVLIHLKMAVLHSH